MEIDMNYIHVHSKLYSVFSERLHFTVISVILSYHSQMLLFPTHILLVILWSTDYQCVQDHNTHHLYLIYTSYRPAQEAAQSSFHYKKRYNKRVDVLKTSQTD